MRAFDAREYGDLRSGGGEPYGHRMWRWCSPERSSAVGARRQNDTEGEKEDQEVLEDEHLTLSSTACAVKA